MLAHHLGKKPGTGLSRSDASPAPGQHAVVHRVAVQQVRASASGPAAAPTSTDVAAVRATVSSGGQPLEASVRDDMEGRFATDFSAVKVHAGADAARSARAVSALAYTVGDHIVLGQQVPSVASGIGRGILAHELAHVVQQRTGPVAGIPIGDNMSVSDPQDSFERDAARAALAHGVDHLGAMARAPQGDPAESARAIRHFPGPVQAAHADAHPSTHHAMGDVIQRCLYCGNPQCAKGEKCGGSATHGGLLPIGSDTMRVKNYNQSQGHGGRPEEWEHIMPGAAYRGAGVGKLYRTAPVLAIPKEMHRGAVQGAGGGITSTGSSETARQFSAGLAGMVTQGNFSGALRLALADELNAGIQHGMNPSEMANGLLRIIEAHQQRGDITPQEAVELKNFVMNTALNQQERPGLYGGH